MADVTMTLLSAYRITGEGEHADRHSRRVSGELWKQYVAATKKLNDLTAKITERGDEPVFVTPDQEAAFRKASRPGAWIVVRSEGMEGRADSLGHAPESPYSAIPKVVEPSPQPLVDPADVPPEPAAPSYQSILRQRCPDRKGLPHQILHYVITDQPGRIDGLCQCGLRIPNVQCPHRKQKAGPNGDPTCEMCNQPIIKQTGFIDNRSGKDGAFADPNKPLPVPTGAASPGDKNNIAPRAYRAVDG